MSGLLTVGYFLFSLLFGLLSFIFWVRIALRYIRVSALHPMSKGIQALTDPIIQPIAMILFRTKTRKSPYDWPCFCVLVIVELLKFIILGAVFLNGMIPWSLLPLYVLADLIVQPCHLLFYAIIIRIIMSWVNPHWQHPAAEILSRITEPLLRLGHRIIPNISGFDFAPYLILVFLKIITLFITASLPMNLLS
jgi:YggT family protein